MDDKALTLNARHVLAENIRKLRKNKDAKLSQEKLADIAGLHRTYIGAIERGEQNVSIDNIERIANALGCAVDELLRKGDE